MSPLSSPWTVPDSWTWALIGDVAGVVGGGTPRTTEASNFDDGTVPWLTPADLSGYTEKYIGQGGRNITTRGLKNSGAILLPTGTVLFSSRAPIGYVAIASNPLAPNQGFKSFVLPPGLDSEFVYYYLQRAKELAVGLASGTAFQEVSGRQAAKIPLSIAPLREQHRIVEALDSYVTRLDDAVATLERVQRNLTRYRASVLKAAVDGRLVPTEAELARAEGRDYEPASVLLDRILAERRRRWEDAELAKMRANGKSPRDDGWKQRYEEPREPDTTGLPKLSDGWCWASIDQIGDVTGGLTQNAKRTMLPRQVPFLRVANVYADELRLGEIKTIGVTEAEIPRVRLVPGDLLVVEGNGSIEQIGRVALWDGAIDLCLHQNHLIKVRFSPVELGAWALCWLLAPTGRAAIQRAASSTSGLNTLSISKVAHLPIPIAPLAEQRRAAAEVDRLATVALAATNDIRTSTDRCTRLRQSILKWAFEGHLVGQDPTDEPASTLLERIRAERASATADGSRSGQVSRGGRRGPGRERRG